ncbi:hypothetical protein [Mycobacteroides abscessus]|uniref:hypothetical protein n=1 Tax=Mycobacteroides abscessus TaxID=36809 RepID=UPI001055020C|nr:hypothetical protein [Mycobacteroides abscessus]MBN7527481.1 hypothetical protein [Mycobacteroides abscessus subsp. massiliense]MDM3940794.1 hypothetical protein [Mycobacteroides abscessus]MDO3056769.1 hypothetical protein [Mycobacteroides abscessus subsp. massiliense]
MPAIGMEAGGVLFVRAAFAASVVRPSGLFRPAFSAFLSSAPAVEFVCSDPGFLPVSDRLAFSLDESGFDSSERLAPLSLSWGLLPTELSCGMVNFPVSAFVMFDVVSATSSFAWLL